jgi:hypothetical protein
MVKFWIEVLWHIGLILICVGIALIYWPLSLIAIGLYCAAMAILWGLQDREKKDA